MKSYLTIAAEMDSHHQTKKEQLQGSEEYQNFYADNEDESEDEFTSMYEWSEKLNPSFDPFHDYLAKV